MADYFIRTLRVIQTNFRYVLIPTRFVGARVKLCRGTQDLTEDQFIAAAILRDTICTQNRRVLSLE